MKVTIRKINTSNNKEHPSTKNISIFDTDPTQNAYIY